MKLAVAGLSGPVLTLANAVQRVLDDMFSVPSRIVATEDDLPAARPNDGRRYLIRDYGGQPGEATALNGVWYKRGLT